MVEVLHRDLAGVVREQGDDVIGAVVGRGVAQRRHAVGVLQHVLHAGDPLPRGRRGRRLGHGIHAHVLRLAVDGAEAAGNRLQERLGVRHVVVAHEGALGGDVGQRHHGTPFLQRVLLIEGMQQLVERERGDVQGLGQEVVVQGLVGTALAHVRRHADGVQHEVERAAEMLHGAVHQRAEVLERGGVGGDQLAAMRLGK